MRTTFIRRRFLVLSASAAALAAMPAWAQTTAPIPARPYVPPKVSHPIPKTAKPLKLGVIGAGNVGGALGAVWAKAGHHIMFSDRDPATAKARAGENPGATSGTNAEAIAFADVVVATIPFGAWPDFAKEFGPALKNKIVFEMTNPNLERDGAVGQRGQAMGAGLYIASLLPGVKITRGMSTIAAALMSSEAGRPAPRVGIPVMANDPAAKAIGMQLVSDAGFDAVDAGDLSAAPKFATGSPGAGAKTAAELRAFIAK
jgi:predicted dinucleotide-binding enzyme